MTDFDPFSDVDNDDTPAPFEEPAPKKAAPKKAATKAATDREGVTVTLKGGAGFDAPWIVIHATDIQDAYEQFNGDNATVLAQLMDKAKSAAKHFGGGSAGNTSGGRAPQGAVEAPPGTPEAPGPDWVYKTGVGKNGKTWKAWMPPRGSNQDPVWIRD